MHVIQATILLWTRRFNSEWRNKTQLSQIHVATDQHSPSIILYVASWIRSWQKQYLPSNMFRSPSSIAMLNGSIRFRFRFVSKAWMTSHSVEAPKQDKVPSAIFTSVRRVFMRCTKSMATSSGNFFDCVFSTSHSQRRLARLRCNNPSQFRESNIFETNRGLPLVLW